MKSTNNLSANLTRTLLLILGIVVALLLTLNSGLIGDASSFISTFESSESALVQQETPSHLEQLSLIISAGKAFFVEINELLKTI